MTVPLITEYPGVVPDPFGSQDASAFSVNSFTFTKWQADDLGPDFNASINQFNIDVATVNSDAADAAESATDAESSAQNAASSANFAGSWSTLTGAYSKGVTVFDNGAYWGLLVDLVDITLSQPTATNSDWAFKSGNRWQNVTASMTLAVNSQVQVLSDTAATDADFTLPTFAINDFFVLFNSNESTEVVRIVKPGVEVFGKRGTIVAGDNITIQAGDTIHLVARTLTKLEVV